MTVPMPHHRPRGPMLSAPSTRPTLHLSGPKLRTGLETLIRASEAIGGIERFAEAARLRSEVIQERLGDGRIETLAREDFEPLVRFMPTVRRRWPGLVERRGWDGVRAAMTELLADAHVPGAADVRVARFEAALSFPSSHPSWGRNSGRVLRDLAAELLHAVHPEVCPLMTRWVWDAAANTGVLREIWHDAALGDDVDAIHIAIPDGHETVLVLREELAQFLTDNGIFRDVIWYVDLLEAQIYAGYIDTQGAAWLKTEFASEGDPLEHTRRILGLDVRTRK